MLVKSKTGAVSGCASGQGGPTKGAFLWLIQLFLALLKGPIES